MLDNKFNVHFNLKKIRRLVKAPQEHTTCENIANRLPYKVLLTDITYLFYGDNKKCYLSTMKDAEINEILAYHISESMILGISLETVKNYIVRRMLF